MQIIGHRAIIDYFDSRIQNQSLHHAYTFVGPAQVGKTTVATWLSAQLLSTPIDRLLLHPDFLLVQQQTDEQTGKMKKDIHIEQIEQVVQKVASLPVAAPYQIVLIEGAEKMNRYASNALLKTLEEPSSRTIFFLTVEYAEDLLPTILSRSQTVRFSRISEAEMHAGLESYHLNSNLQENMVHFGAGLPGKALEWARSPELFEAYQEERDRFFSLFGKSFFLKMQMTEYLFPDKKNHIAGRKKITRCLAIWQECLREMIQNPELMARRVTPAEMIVLFDRIEYASSQLKKNIHPRLLIEHILLSLP